MPLQFCDSESLKIHLQRAGEHIRAALPRFLPAEEPSEVLYDLLKDYPSRGGKGFRSGLVLLCCEIFCGDAEPAINTAVAFELFHNFALIHDDIEDGSVLRRGKPAMHQQHGIPLALNAGDAMYGLVYEALLANREILGDAKALDVMAYASKVFRTTFEGQALDIGFVARDVFPTREQYQQMIVRKTGWYSGKGPCQVGALVGGASPEEFVAIGEFGMNVGIAFQTRDDVLNLITHSAEEAPTHGSGGYGKERGGDIAEGKRTLITIEMFERLPQSDADRLHKILSQPREDTTEEQIEWSIALAESCGALDAAVQYCQTHADKAMQALNGLPERAGKALLAELVQYLAIDRNQ